LIFRNVPLGLFSGASTPGEISRLRTRFKGAFTVPVSPSAGGGRKEIVKPCMLYITRRLEFSASHRLFNPEFTEAQNREIFGNCSNPNGHGHNYTLEVTVCGQVDPQTGMVLELKSLKQLIAKELIDRVDHKNLNIDVDFLQGVIPTLENMAVHFWDLLQSKIHHGRLHELKLFESDKNFVVYRGPQREGTH